MALPGSPSNTFRARWTREGACGLCPVKSSARRGGLLRGYEGDARDATGRRPVIWWEAGWQKMCGEAGWDDELVAATGNRDGNDAENGNDNLEDSHVPMTGLARPSAYDMAPPSVSSGATKRLPPRRAWAGCAGRAIGPHRTKPGYWRCDWAPNFIRRAQ